MIYFQGKKVKEIYFRGKKVKELWFNGKKYFSGFKQIVIEYERTSEPKITATDQNARKKQIYFNQHGAKPVPDAKKVVEAKIEYIVNPHSTHAEAKVKPGTWYVIRFELQPTPSMLKSGYVYLLEPVWEVKRKDDWMNQMMDFIPLYKVRITITYE